MKSLRLLVMFGVLLAAPAFGQGCAMCKANVASAPAETQRALRRGIFALLIPSLGAIIVLGGIAYKHRD
jgi:hypothetical protein